MFNIKSVRQKAGQYELHTKLTTAIHHDSLQGSPLSHRDWTPPVAHVAWGPDWPQQTTSLRHPSAQRYMSHSCTSLPVTQLHIATCHTAAHRYLSPSCTSLRLSPSCTSLRLSPSCASLRLPPSCTSLRLSHSCTSLPVTQHSVQFRILGIIAFYSWIRHSGL